MHPSRGHHAFDDSRLLPLVPSVASTASRGCVDHHPCDVTLSLPLCPHPIRADPALAEVAESNRLSGTLGELWDATEVPLMAWKTSVGLWEIRHVLSTMTRKNESAPP